MIPRWLRKPFGRNGDDRRWVVVDVEASGLDAGSDRLLAVAGVAIAFDQQTPRLQLADSFEAILRQEVLEEGSAVDRPNILLHGIGVGAQRAGAPPAEALAAFFRWAGDAPILGYHSAFDRTLIRRHGMIHLGRHPANVWVDLEHVVLLLVPGLPDRSLDAAIAHRPEVGDLGGQARLEELDAVAVAQLHGVGRGVVGAHRALHDDSQRPAQEHSR